MYLGSFGLFERNRYWHSQRAEEYDDLVHYIYNISLKISDVDTWIGVLFPSEIRLIQQLSLVPAGT